MPSSTFRATVPTAAQPLAGLGQALRWLREKQTRKQYRVADSAGITKGMLSAYETGRQRPSLDTLAKLLETLDCDLNDLHNALQIVNGRPERIKSWRGWQTATWAGGPTGATLAGGPSAAAGGTAIGLTGPGGATAAAAPSFHTAGEVCEPGVPYRPDAPTGPHGPRLPDGSGSPPSDLYTVLGVDHSRLAFEEEQAFNQMLTGFHRLLRYWHHSLTKPSGD